MNVPDLRNVDFDAYRERAFELRRRARQESLDRIGSWLRTLFARQPRASRLPATHVASASARFAA